MIDLTWMKELRPDISEKARPQAIREAFDWLVADKRGQLVLATVLYELGFLDQIRATEPVAMAIAVERRNVALGILGHVGTDAVHRVINALVRKEQV